ncbi:MAG: helix-turn-helix domain-containing protein [Terriglobia bacterium]
MGLTARKNIFTPQEVCALLGLSKEDLQFLANSRKIGQRVKSGSKDGYRYDRNDLAILAILAARLSRRRL